MRYNLWIKLPEFCFVRMILCPQIWYYKTILVTKSKDFVKESIVYNGEYRKSVPKRKLKAREVLALHGLFKRGTKNHLEKIFQELSGEMRNEPWESMWPQICIAAYVGRTNLYSKRNSTATKQWKRSKWTKSSSSDI